MSTRKKSIIMFVLAIVLIIMGVGYAAARTVLSINGTANLEATWDVSITGITEGEAKGKAYNKETPSYTGTNARFNVGFKSLGDSMDYEVTITNNGTIDAVISNILISFTLSDKKDTSKISYIMSGIKKGDIIKSTEEKKFHIILDYPEYMDVPTEELQLRYNVSIDLESYNSNKSYSQKYDINDRIILDDNSIWRVLKSSSEKDENVTLIKETGIKNLSSIDPIYSISGIQNYLNSEYKESLSENIKANLVGNIEIPKYVNFDNKEYKSDSKYLADFLYGTVTNCVDSISNRNCNLNWLMQHQNSMYVNDNSIQFANTNLYTIADGEFVVDCSDSMMGNTKDTLVYNSQTPIIWMDMQINNYKDPSNRRTDISPFWGIIQKNGQTKLQIKTCIINDFSQQFSSDDIILHPVITINKSAIK